ncbi:MAG: flagellar basal body P-ring protein FlgI [Verrucomicrobiota bacterium]
MYRRILSFVSFLVLACITIKGTGFAQAGARVKDLTFVEGSRDNQLVGYGLVVGLSGTGDSSLTYTIQSIANTLQRFGITVPAGEVQAENVAAVMLTATLGPYSREGSQIDVTVSSLGDADTLQGGVLLQTPLLGADDLVYAVAQGPVAVGGFLGGGGGDGGSTVQQNHPTVGILTSGAIVERSVNTQLVIDESLNLILRNADFTSAVRMADAINAQFPSASQAIDYGTINVSVPSEYIGQEVNFLAEIGGIMVKPDTVARIIVNERTGTIVATSEVRISTVAISHGSLTITITNDTNVSQPNPLANGETVESNVQATAVNEATGGFQVLESFPTIEDLTQALNALGVTTREMIAILQNLKRAGALQAELILN